MTVSTAELVAALASLLERRGLSIVTAESCTGGLIAAALTDRPGSSQYFDRGYVTYSNQAKVELLSVGQDLIDKFGAVSAQVAAAMAAGALDKRRKQVSIAVTGIAGPGGGSQEKPVGLVYIAACYPGGECVDEFHFSGDRSAIRAQTRDAALSVLLDRLSA